MTAVLGPFLTPSLPLNAFWPQKAKLPYKKDERKAFSPPNIKIKMYRQLLAHDIFLE